jgi:hypothetical protein
MILGVEVRWMQPSAELQQRRINRLPFEQVEQAHLVRDC